jgi:circadian clock protein KaiC
MPHSNQIREFLLTDQGVDLVDVYVGPAGVLTGAARSAQEAQERAEAVNLQQELERRRKTLEARMAVLREEFEAEEEEIKKGIERDRLRQQALSHEREEIARIRKADS